MHKMLRNSKAATTQRNGFSLFSINFDHYWARLCPDIAPLLTGHFEAEGLGIEFELGFKRPSECLGEPEPVPLSFKSDIFR